jgi:hypothetical protein
MIRRIWTKIVIAGLVILGEGAFASESNQRIDDRYEISANAVQLSQPADLDEAGTNSKPSLAAAKSIQPVSSLAYQSIAAVSVPVSGLIKHHPCNPRAPPVPTI